MNLVITKVDKQIWSGKAKSVNVPGSEGEMTILPHHSALVSLLKKGTIRITDTAGNTETYAIDKGLIEVSDNNVTILL